MLNGLMNIPSKRMTVLGAYAALLCLFVLVPMLLASCKKEEKKVSFSQEVFPLLKKRCVGCHYPGNEFNESKLAMNTYEALMAGGVHGPPVVPGNSGKSLMVQKLGLKPPFGDQMPLMSKQKLTEEEIALISKWIDQGAANN
jgi:uncharacterized membrane protein